MKLAAMISINGGEPIYTQGSCCRTMMQNAGLDPVWFRENGNLITSWQWLVGHDGPKTEHQTEEPKKKLRISEKRLTKLDQKWANWSK